MISALFLTLESTQFTSLMRCSLIKEICLCVLESTNWCTLIVFFSYGGIGRDAFVNGNVVERYLNLPCNIQKMIADSLNNAQCFTGKVCADQLVHILLKLRIGRFVSE